MCPWTVRRKPAPDPVAAGFGTVGTPEGVRSPHGCYAPHGYGATRGADATLCGGASTSSPPNPGTGVPGSRSAPAQPGTGAVPAVWPFVKRPHEGAVVLRGVDGSVPIDDDADCSQ